MFDVQIKRIHEYKRQLLNVLRGGRAAMTRSAPQPTERLGAARVKIFAGKAAASYSPRQAHHQADPRRRRRWSTTIPIVRDRLKVVFVPELQRVAWPRCIIPAADLSEQISTAGMEASGTGNMKLALNGALTIGTLDGANVEIREHVGDENIFIFGLDHTRCEAAARQRLRRRAPVRDELGRLKRGAGARSRSGVFSRRTIPTATATLVDCPGAARPLHGRRGLRRRMPAARRGLDARCRDPRGLAANGRSLNVAKHGLVLLGPHDPRIRRRKSGHRCRRRKRPRR
jgi:glucan phosphorylase